MDPIITVPMLVSALTKALDSAAGEAGKKAWSALSTLLTKHRRQTPNEADAAAAPLLRPDPRDIEPFAQHLATLAVADPALAQSLHDWAAETARTFGSSENTVNTLSGTVHGNVVQAGNISGSVSFS
ncbi:hypothetical protein ABH920_009473 [Catenulispora sp. EB89]|uniref:hypothetical protein n=1 Tax=Catenulispora sp. EB89 TaxID=3156257 RepID=UPI003511DCAB